MAYLGKKGYTVFKKDLTSSQIAKIRDELTVKPHTTHGQEPSYPIYLESDRKFYLPRYYGIEELGKVEMNLSPGQTIVLPFTGSLFPYQEKIIDTYLSYVGKSGGGLLDVEPGKGKTVMGELSNEIIKYETVANQRRAETEVQKVLIAGAHMKGG
jgi:hypothetical protein